MEKEIKSWVNKAMENTGFELSPVGGFIENDDDSGAVMMRIEHTTVRTTGVMDIPESFYKQYDQECRQFTEQLKAAVKEYTDRVMEENRERGMFSLDMRAIWIESNRQTLVGFAENMNLIITVQNTDEGFTISVMYNAE